MLKQVKASDALLELQTANLLLSSGRGSTGTILGWYRDAEQDSKLLQFLLQLQYSSNLGWGSAETSKGFRCAFGAANSLIYYLLVVGVPLVQSWAGIGMLSDI